MAFFTSIFRKKEGGAVPEKPGFSFSRFKEALSKHTFTPIRKKEGGVVQARTPFQQAIHDTFLKAAGGGGIHYRKKGGVVKKTKAPIAKKKGKKKGKDKK
jgi:hypothetical protein